MPARPLSPICKALVDVLAAFRQGQLLELGAVRPPHRPHPVRRHQGRPASPSSHDRLEAILGCVKEAAVRANFPAPSSTLPPSRPSAPLARRWSAKGRGACVHRRHSAERRDDRWRDVRWRGRGRDLSRRPAGRPEEALRGGLEGALHFVISSAFDSGASFPHIRLDRALEFLLGDRFA